MAFKHGFYNSVNGDRRYWAEDMNNFLGGLLTDGIYPAYLGEMKVTTYGTASGKPQICVAPGRAWVFNTWCYNDANAYLTIEPNSSGTTRTDHVVLQADKTNRLNSLKVITGALSFTNALRHYLLADVAVPTGTTTTVSQAAIINKVGMGSGTDGTPYTSPIFKAKDPQITQVTGKPGLYTFQ